MWTFLTKVMDYLVHDILDRLDIIIENQVKLKELLMGTKEEMTALTAQVQQNTDVENSAIVLIQGIAAQLASIANDPAAIRALAGQLKTSSDALAAAIVANTPATEPSA